MKGMNHMLLTPQMHKIRRARGNEYHILRGDNIIIDKVWITRKELKESPYNTLRKVK